MEIEAESSFSEGSPNTAIRGTRHHDFATADDFGGSLAPSNGDARTPRATGKRGLVFGIAGAVLSLVVGIDVASRVLATLHAPNASPVHMEAPGAASPPAFVAPSPPATSAADTVVAAPQASAPASTVQAPPPPAKADAREVPKPLHAVPKVHAASKSPSPAVAPRERTGR